MIDLLPYILKSSACFGICYAFYFFVLRKENTFVFNRFYLMATVLLSIALPLSNLTIHIPDFKNLISLKESVPIAESTMVYTTNTIASIQPEEAAKGINYMFYAIVAYLLISLVFLIRFMINVTRIMMQKSKGRKLDYKRSTLVLAISKIAPYSFLKYIFLNEDDYESGLISEEIIIHEKAHCDQLHTVDVLFIETIKILFWWNPMVWLYKKSMQLNHEYLADQFALQQVNTTDYQRAIISALENSNSVALGSHFNYYSIKNRFKMMTTQKMKTNQKLSKAFMFLPVLVILFAFSVNIEAQEVEKKEKVVKTTKEIKQDKKVKIVLDDENLTKEEIDALIEKELKKHGLDPENVNVNVNTNDGDTEIIIKCNSAAFIDEDGAIHDLKNKDAKIKIIKKELDGSEEEVKVIVKEIKGEDGEIMIIKKELSGDRDEIEMIIERELEGKEIEIEKLLEELEIEREGLEQEIKVIKIHSDELGDNMEHIEMHLGDKYGVHDKSIEVIECDGKSKKIMIHNDSDDGESQVIEIDGNKIIINGVEVDTENQKKKKRKKNK